MSCRWQIFLKASIHFQTLFKRSSTLKIIALDAYLINHDDLGSGRWKSNSRTWSRSDRIRIQIRTLLLYIGRLHFWATQGLPKEKLRRTTPASDWLPIGNNRGLIFRQLPKISYIHKEKIPFHNTYKGHLTATVFFVKLAILSEYTHSLLYNLKECMFCPQNRKRWQQLE